MICIDRRFITQNVFECIGMFSFIRIPGCHIGRVCFMNYDFTCAEFNLFLRNGMIIYLIKTTIIVEVYIPAETFEEGDLGVCRRIETG